VLKRPKEENNMNVPNEPLVDKILNTRAVAGKRRVEGGGTRDHEVFAR
jgi:hypothetical protein